VLPRLTDEFDVLLESIDALEGGMARAVLDEGGIPSMLHGPDFDVVEMGFTAHARARGTELLVPRGMRAAARQVLVDAWGEDAVQRHEPAP